MYLWGLRASAESKTIMAEEEEIFLVWINIFILRKLLTVRWGWMKEDKTIYLVENALLHQRQPLARAVREGIKEGGGASCINWVSNKAQFICQINHRPFRLAPNLTLKTRGLFARIKWPVFKPSQTLRFWWALAGGVRVVRGLKAPTVCPWKYPSPRKGLIALGASPLTRISPLTPQQRLSWEFSRFGAKTRLSSGRPLALEGLDWMVGPRRLPGRFGVAP